MALSQRTRRGSLCGLVGRTEQRRLAACVLAVVGAHWLVSMFWMPRARPVDTPVIHVRAEHALVEILAPAGARVYYTKDGTDPGGKGKTMELYLGPFTLKPGMWQLAAIAKRAGHPDSAEARFPVPCILLGAFSYLLTFESHGASSIFPTSFRTCSAPATRMTRRCFVRRPTAPRRERATRTCARVLVASLLAPGCEK